MLVHLLDRDSREQAEQLDRSEQSPLDRRGGQCISI
jgi:hypothetical protein